MANILIAGYGYVGRRLAELLVADGHQVYALSRREKAVPDGVIALHADLTEPLPPDLVPASLDIVFYLASATGKREEAVYQAIYVEGPQRLLGWLQEHHPEVQRFLFTSSTSVYAQTDGEWVDETSATEPSSFSGQRMLEGEAGVLSNDVCQSIVVRFSGIYGPDRMRWTQTSPANKRFTNHIHREDCARVLRFLMELSDPASIYLATDCEPYVRTGGEVVASRRAAGNKRCSNKRLLDAGYPFVYPTYREGYVADENR